VTTFAPARREGRWYARPTHQNAAGEAVIGQARCCAGPFCRQAQPPAGSYPGGSVAWLAERERMQACSHRRADRQHSHIESTVHTR
jgi:hypothetical protein